MALMMLAAVQCPVRGQGQTLSGRVTDCGSQLPIAGAVVRVAGTNSGISTDGKGFYAFHNLKPTTEPYIIDFTLMGMKPLRTHIRIADRQTATADVCLEPDAAAIGEVVVKAKPPVQKIRESPLNAAAIDAKALHNTSLTLTGALDRISGVKIRETGGVGSAAQISLNGFSGNHVKIFMDGMPLEQAGSAFQLNNIPVALADRIEVYKGVVPVELGADALGGAINIVSNRSRATYVDASYSYGSFNTHKTSISAGHTTGGGFLVRLSAYQNYSDNNYRIKTKLLDLAANTYSKDEQWFRRFHDTYHNEAIIAQAGIVRRAWADQLTLEVNVSREKADIQHSNLMQIVYGGRTRQSLSVLPSLHYVKRNAVQGLDVSLKANYGLVRAANTDTLARQYNWQGEYRPKGVKGEGQYAMGRYNNHNAHLAAGIHYRLGEWHRFALNNLAGGYTRIAADPAANAETAAAAFMRRTSIKNVLGLSYAFEPNRRLSASAFVKRYDIRAQGPVDVSTSGAAEYSGQSRTFGASGGGIAAALRPAPPLQVKASFEKAYRLPTETELFGDEILETGSAALRPESSHNINFNISYDNTFGAQHSIYLDAGAVYRLTSDYIRRQIEQRYGGAFYANHGKVRTWGVDAQARWFYASAPVSLSAGATLTWQDIRNMERYALDGRELIYYMDRMPNVPYLFGGIDAGAQVRNLVWKGSTLRADYGVRYIHSFYRHWQSEGGSITIPRQWAHDLTLTCSLHNGRYNIALELRNIADALLYDNYSLQKAGRSVYLKLRYFFHR